MIESLKIPMKEIDAKAAKICEYFAEDSSGFKLDAFMITLNTFLQRFDKAIKVSIGSATHKCVRACTHAYRYSIWCCAAEICRMIWRHEHDLTT